MDNNIFKMQTRCSPVSHSKALGEKLLDAVTSTLTGMPVVISGEKERPAKLLDTEIPKNDMNDMEQISVGKDRSHGRTSSRKRQIDTTSLNDPQPTKRARTKQSRVGRDGAAQTAKVITGQNKCSLAVNLRCKPTSNDPAQAGNFRTAEIPAIQTTIRLDS
jgi:hypothetical protein